MTRLTTAVTTLIALALSSCGGGGGGSSPQPVTTLPPSPPVNAAPSAKITASASEVDEGESFELSASDSTDPENDPLTYLWSQTSGPEISIDDATAVTLELIMPVTLEDVMLGFTLEVSDGEKTNSAEIEILNRDLPIPVAKIVAEKTEDYEGQFLILSGEESSHPNGAELTYKWEEVSDEIISIFSRRTDSTGLRLPEVDQDDTIEIKLTVSDGTYESSDTISLDILNIKNLPLNTEFSNKYEFDNTMGGINNLYASPYSNDGTPGSASDYVSAFGLFYMDCCVLGAVGGWRHDGTGSQPAWGIGFPSNGGPKTRFAMTLSASTGKIMKDHSGFVLSGRFYLTGPNLRFGQILEHDQGKRLPLSCHIEGNLDLSDNDGANIFFSSAEGLGYFEVNKSSGRHPFEYSDTVEIAKGEFCDFIMASPGHSDVFAIETAKRTVERFDMTGSQAAPDYQLSASVGYDRPEISDLNWVATDIDLIVDDTAGVNKIVFGVLLSDGEFEGVHKLVLLESDFDATTGKYGDVIFREIIDLPTLGAPTFLYLDRAKAIIISPDNPQATILDCSFTAYTQCGNATYLEIGLDFQESIFLNVLEEDGPDKLVFSRRSGMIGFEAE